MTAEERAGYDLTIDQLVTRLATATGTPECLVRLNVGLPAQEHTEPPTSAEDASNVYQPPRYPHIPAADDPDMWANP